MDVIAEMASVTYKRLEAAMEDPQAAIENEAWELVAVLVELLRQQNTISREKQMGYAKGIRDFSMEMYMEKLARFRGNSHCKELAEYWLIGKSLVESLEQTSQPMSIRRAEMKRFIFNHFLRHVLALIPRLQYSEYGTPQTGEKWVAIWFSWLGHVFWDKRYLLDPKDGNF